VALDVREASSEDPGAEHDSSKGSRSSASTRSWPASLRRWFRRRPVLAVPLALLSGPSVLSGWWFRNELSRPPRWWWGLSVTDKVEILKVLLSVLAGSFALYEWRRREQRNRADRFDAFVDQFYYRDGYLKLAGIASDYPARTTVAPNGTNELTYTSEDVVRALDLRTKGNDLTKVQLELRDAFDKMFAFYARLQRAIVSDLIPGEWAKESFCFYIKSLLTMERHAHVFVNGVSARTIVAEYVTEYYDRAAYLWLCDHWDINTPELLKQLEAKA